MKRTAIKPGKPLKRRTPLRSNKPPNPMSARTKARIPERQRCREQVWERAGGRCEALAILPHVCQGPGPLQVHEPLTRARGGDPLDPDQCLLVCPWSHRWIHAHPAQSIPLGLLKHSWDVA